MIELPEREIDFFAGVKRVAESACGVKKQHAGKKDDHGNEMQTVIHLQRFLKEGDCADKCQAEPDEMRKG